MNGYSVREQRAWYFYDWANSAFTTTVVTLFLGPYLTTLARAAAASDGKVKLFGISLAAQSIWPFAVSLSVATQVLALPLFGAIADYGRRKRELLFALTAVGSGATIAMFGLTGGRYLAGCLLFLIANFCFGAAVVIYNSFLPEIAPEDQRDSVSSKGWAAGYCGGGLLLALNLLLYAKADAFGISGSTAVRLSLASAGVWWLAFSMITFAGLRNHGARRTAPPGQSQVGAALRQLRHTIVNLPRYPQTLLFLVAFLIYNDAIQTVFTMAAQFGAEELHLGMDTLTSAILMTQFVALGGALLFNQLAARIGNKHSVMIALAVWSLTLIAIYGFVYTAAHFYIAAAAIAVVMGGSQALSRSIYSLMIPKGREAEYFSLYEISDKGTSWLGPLFFGLALQWTGQFRIAVLSLIVFFLLGMVLLSRVDIHRAAAEAGNSVLNGTPAGG